MGRLRDFRAAWLLGAAVLAGWAATAHAAVPVYEGCTPPPTRFKRVRHATPGTLAAILRDATDGDAIYLSGGDYGAVHLKGANHAYVLVAAEPGQKPILASLGVSGSHWWVNGLTITGLAPKHFWGKWQAHDYLVRVGPGDNFILDANEVTSQPGKFPWTRSVEGALDEYPLSSGILAENMSCATITKNKIFNIFNAIQALGDQKANNGKYIEISGNRIDDFAGDGIDYAASFIEIGHNLITNGHDICESKCVHTDGIQGWTFNGLPGITNQRVVIDGNTIIDRTDPALELPAGTLQGITIFDGFWKNVDIYNNVVIVDAWHGISIYGVDGLNITNNTVLPSGDRPTWIMAGGTTHQGGQSRDITLRNNIGVSVQIKGDAPSSKLDHNFIVKSPGRLFVAFEPKKAVYDLHLRPGSRAAKLGSRAGAPLTDIDGRSRTDHVSVGAYD